MTTYKRINSVTLTTKIIKFIGERTRAVSVKEITNALNEPHGTIMCHLATLEDAGFVRPVNGHYELGAYIGIIWAAIKRNKEESLKQLQNDLKQLEIN
jgi:DNA-binding IclR family transcriptional regulator